VVGCPPEMGYRVSAHEETPVGRVELEDGGLAVVRFDAGVHVDVDAMRGIIAAQETLGAVGCSWTPAPSGA